jgi:BirA family transcriptional regulator, biotin operon repressor / biotin---[acetyl-CoA-carboxylase] ligase
VTPIPIELWPARLEALTERCTRWKWVIVLRETDSTQDAARRMGCVSGEVVTAWRQTCGRGRLGRRWIDTSEHGVAVTFVVDRESGNPERLAHAAAVATAKAAQCFLAVPVRIKPPNDIMVEGRKIAGVLIEQADDRGLIGVGINVRQEHWPEDLACKAASMVQCGAHVDRLDVLEALMRTLDESLHADAAEIRQQFEERALGMEAPLITTRRILSPPLDTRADSSPRVAGA